MPSFPRIFCKSNKRSLIWLLLTMFAVVGWLLSQDMNKLIPIEPTQKIQECLLRLQGLTLIILLFVASALIIVLISYKKEIDAKYPTDTTPEENERILKLLNRDKAEIELLKKELVVHKKYLAQYAPAGFDIDQAEEYEKGWNDAGNHIKE